MGRWDGNRPRHVFLAGGGLTLKEGKSGDILILNGLALVCLCALYRSIAELSNFIRECIDYRS